VNILHVNMSLDSVNGGTVERIRQLHISMQQLGGVSSHVLSIATGESPALSPSDDVTLLPCWNRRWYLPAPKFFTMYRWVCWADVIHIMNHWTIFNAIIYWMARMMGKPYVICPAGALPLFGRSTGFKRWYNRLVGKALVKNSAAAITIAADEIKELNKYGVPEERIQHIPNGVRFDDFSCSDGQAFRDVIGLGSADFLLFVGRLNAIKGPDILLDAFVEMSSRFPLLHLVFAGPDGGLLEDMKSKAVKEGVADRVHFAGFVAGHLKASAYHGASLLVVPSRQEAMSIVALEGAVCGIPVLLTDQCGFDALAQHGAARLTQANPSSIAEAIIELMADSELRKEMGRRGRCLAIECYTWDIAARRCVDMFESVLGATRR